MYKAIPDAYRATFTLKAVTMTLDQIAAGTKSLSDSLVAADTALAIDIQNRLSAIGLLDPPADGRFGPVSQWALAKFLERALGATTPMELGPLQAKALLDRGALEMFPLTPGDDFAGKVVKAMAKRGDWVCRHPDCINIVYVDGYDTSGAPNENAHNKFDDVRLVVRIEQNGDPVIQAAWEATTEPGTFYVKTQKLNVEGAAHIIAGQYKAWNVGIHKAGSPSAHEALVQMRDIRISRDKDEDFSQVGDKTFVGMFGINQHWGFDFTREDVRTASAGCMVGRTKTGHRQFMTLVKADPRFVVNRAYLFMTSVLLPDLIQ